MRCICILDFVVGVRAIIQYLGVGIRLENGYEYSTEMSIVSDPHYQQCGKPQSLGNLYLLPAVFSCSYTCPCEQMHGTP